jgi:hypothetical protein
MKEQIMMMMIKVVRVGPHHTHTAYPTPPSVIWTRLGREWRETVQGTIATIEVINGGNMGRSAKVR